MTKIRDSQLHNPFKPIETEIDFGSTPVDSASFVITDANVSTTNIIFVHASPNPATGRVGNDWEFDHASFSALPGTGQFTLSVVLAHGAVGKRKIYYTILNN